MRIVFFNRSYHPDPEATGQYLTELAEDLVELIAELTGFEGDIVWDTSQPDGQPRRRLDTSRAKREFAFEATTGFREGLMRTIRWCERNASWAQGSAPLRSR